MPGNNQQPKTIGPRASLKSQHYRDIARAQYEIKLEESSVHQDAPLQSEAESMNIHATGRIVRPSCLNVSSEEDLKDMPGKAIGQAQAVTFWRAEPETQKPHFKCTSFTNDIKDSRIRYSEEAHE